MIEGEGFRIRHWRWEDAPALVRHANNYEIARWLQNFPYPYEPIHAAEFLERVFASTPGRAFAIEIDGEACGSLMAIPMEGDYARCASIGYWLGAEYWRRGILSRALPLLLDHLFEERGVERVEARVHQGNIRSSGLLQKTGFRLEGTMRKRLFAGECFLDEEWYGMLREEWLTRRGLFSNQRDHWGTT